jgi:putative peptidoglycan lipid II flippase
MGFGSDPAKLALTATLTRIMFPFFLFIALAAWAMGVLNACGSFFVPALAPAAFNVFSALVPAAGVAFFRARGQDPILGMAWGVVAGAAAQFVIQIPGLLRHGFRYAPVLDFRSPEVRQVFRRWLPMILGLATWQVNFLVNTFLLTFLREGSVTWVNYAYRIQHLPAGLFGAAIGSVAIADFAHGMAEDRYAALRSRLRHSLALVSVLTLPAALLLIALAVPVTRLIYQHGRFTASDTTLTAQALALYCLGIWSAAATRNVAAGFYSAGDTRTPALVALGVVLGNIAMNLVLMRVVGFCSFPLAASVTQTLNFAVLWYLLRRRAGRLDGRYIAGLTVRALLAALAAGAAAFGTAGLAARLLGTGHVAGQLVQVAVGGLVGVGVYYVAALVLRVTEVRAALRDLTSPGRG